MVGQDIITSHYNCTHMIILTGGDSFKKKKHTQNPTSCCVSSHLFWFWVHQQFTVMMGGMCCAFSGEKDKKKVQKVPCSNFKLIFQLLSLFSLELEEEKEKRESPTIPTHVLSWVQTLRRYNTYYCFAGWAGYRSLIGAYFHSFCRMGWLS